MKLIITEKPSVAKDIAKALNINNFKGTYIENNNYRISWCFGHLISLETPENYDEKYRYWNLDSLPIIPNKFETKIIPSCSKQYNILKKLMLDSDITEIICATDAGREGELIFRLVYDKVNCKLPVKRLWISSMTKISIITGMNNLIDYKEKENLYKAAKCRSEADWIVGINATRVFSVKNGIKLTIGRVQTPTLNLIVSRYLDNNNFKPETYYQIEANFENNYSGIWFNKNENKFNNINEANKIISKLNNEDKGKVVYVETKNNNIERPLLFDLTELQRECNKIYGYTAQNVLDTAQRLYEIHKVITYPRTDSRYITDDMQDTLIELLNNIAYNNKFGFSDYISDLLKTGLNIDKRLINNEKVTDHHAIIPTNNIYNYDLNQLNDMEINILKLITSRFLIILSDKHEINEMAIIVQINNEQFQFNIRAVKKAGWKILNQLISNENKDENIILNLPEINVGDVIKVNSIKLLTKKTTPQKLYTEATLLTAMEHANKHTNNINSDDEFKSFSIGTPATRASIIEKLINNGYVKRKDKNLLPTELGIKLISILPEYIKSVDMTGNWEKRLKDIENGKDNTDNFMQDIKNWTSEFINTEKTLSYKSIFDNNIPTINEVIGKCPRCGKAIIETSKAFVCVGYKEVIPCKFTMWKDNKFFIDKGKKLTKTIASDLLKGNPIKISGLKKKDGSGTYTANILLDDTGTYVNYKMTF